MAPGSFYYASNRPLQPPIGTPVQPPAVSSSNNGGPDAFDKAELWARIENVLQGDQTKTNLIQELMYRYEYLSDKLDQYSSAGGPELQWANEKRMYEARLHNVQTALSCNPFVVLLVDGDGMIFENDFVAMGEAGGRKAAAELHKAVELYVENETKSIPMESRIICRVYANVKGLADVLVRSGIVEDASVFESFVQGFTRGKILFDFIDVGPGKDRADEKIIETFKLYINDFHCRQIFFGCSHDNGFARALEEYMNDAAYVSKVTLLEGVPFEKELLALPYATKKFPGIFRESKLINPSVPGATTPKIYNIMPGLPPHFPPHNVGHKPDLFRTPSTSTLASDGFPVTTKPLLNWAAKAAAPPPVASPKPTYAPVNRDEVVARNRIGQRVDPPTRDYDKTEVDRIKNMKLCNVHFLRQGCPFGENCTHIHDFNPCANEIAVLRLVARMAPCIHGSGCQDVKCIYGHRCPAPRSKNNPAKGTKTCIFGDTCKFPVELHDIDCNVVKTLVIR
ncbi:unnamed protein product [Periconia digitata]|uniref:C3H1-type domain-containing protein n=1 Tax=Periconia digitata TaxID=1303443 RepID=A0A9W4URR7_9PLEO|nr:unnamed protein product [Periconia digitata]